MTVKIEDVIKQGALARTRKALANSKVEARRSPKLGKRPATKQPKR